MIIPYNPSKGFYTRQRHDQSSCSDSALLSLLLLTQPDLPATVRVTQERMLQMLEENLREKSSQDAQKKYEKKYKMVKFFGELSSIMIIIYNRY